jgi:hypothetical protein
MSKADRQRREAKRGVTLATMPGDVMAEPPQDNGPTPERQAKGAWTVGSGVRVWQDSKATSMHRALNEKAITKEQFDAGELYLALRRSALAIRGASSQRDSLDLMPRGGRETSPEYEARILATDCNVARRLGHELAGAADAFIVRDQSPGRFSLRYSVWRDIYSAFCTLEDFYNGVKP